jgi:uncharacterized protein (TIGR02246 family)
MVRPLTSILALLLVHSAFGGLAHAQTGNSSAPPEAVVKELSKQWSTAIINKDAAILERIWAPDFVSVGPSGQRFTKAQEIAALKASKEKVTVSEVTSLDVRVYGNGTVAVDIGEYHEAGADEERKPYERRSRFTNVWVLRDGSWKCVSGHASTLEPKR